MHPLLPDVIPLATNSSPLVAARVLYAIGSIGAYAGTNDPVVPLLTNSLHHPDLSIRHAAFFALRSLQPFPPEAEPLLIESLNSSDASVSASACEALVARTNQGVLPFLAGNLNSANPYAVTLALDQLSTFRQRAGAALPRVRELRTNSWLPVRQAATNALIAIAGQPALVDLPKTAADISFSFPSIPIPDAMRVYESLIGKRVEPPPNGWPLTLLSIKTHDSVTKSEAQELIEDALKQQANIEIKSGADGTPAAVPIN